LHSRFSVMGHPQPSVVARPLLTETLDFDSAKVNQLPLSSSLKQYLNSPFDEKWKPLKLYLFNVCNITLRLKIHVLLNRAFESRKKYWIKIKI